MMSPIGQADLPRTSEHLDQSDSHRSTARRKVGLSEITEPWRSMIIVALIAAAVRFVLFVLNPHPLFFSDSGTYLEVAHRFYMPPDRPVGVSMFYRAVLSVSYDLPSIVAAQALLGIVPVTLSVLLATQCGLRPVYARGSRLCDGPLAGLARLRMDGSHGVAGRVPQHCCDHVVSVSTGLRRVWPRHCGWVRRRWRCDGPDEQCRVDSCPRLAGDRRRLSSVHRGPRSALSAATVAGSVVPIGGYMAIESRRLSREVRRRRVRSGQLRRHHALLPRLHT